MGNSDAKLTPLMREKLQAYLACIELQEEVGLLLVEDEKFVRPVAKELERKRLRRSYSWKQLMDYLSRNEPTFMVLEQEVTKEVYDIVAQYYKRPGVVQIMDSETMDLEMIQFDKDQANLILVTSIAELRKIEGRFSLRDKIGLTEVL